MGRVHRAACVIVLPLVPPVAARTIASALDLDAAVAYEAGATIAPRRHWRSSAMEIFGKTAIVTGAASGIGLGIATALAEAGANVVMADIETDAVEQAAH